MTLDVTEGIDQERWDLVGQIDLLESNMSGVCSLSTKPAEKFRFEFFLADPLFGTLTYLEGSETPPVERRVVADFINKKIVIAPGLEPDFELVATEAFDYAELTYSIIGQDATFLKIDGEATIQAKLQALEDEDSLGKGPGVTETSAILYNIDGVLQSKEKGKTAGEPKERQTLRFYLNQSFLATQKKSEAQLWQIGSSIISGSGEDLRIFGSLIYEEIGSDEMKLNMFSADCVNFQSLREKNKKEKEMNEKDKRDAN